MNRKATIVVMLSLALVFASCDSGKAPAPPAAAPKTTEAAKPAKPGWQAEWDSTVENARKEGRLVVYTSISAAGRDAISAALKEKYGLEVEWVAGRGGEVAAKISAELKAGLKIVDAVITGPITFANQLKPMGIMAQLDPVFILPEIADPAKWIAGKLLFADKEHTAMQWVEYRTALYALNTDQVKPGEFNTTQDVLNPKWRGGKIVLSDPSVAGNSNEWFTWTWHRIIGESKARQFMMDLAKQEPAISRDERLMTEWVARGKNSIGIGIGPDNVVDFIRKGAPIAFADVQEQRSVAWGGTLLMVPKEPPHPYAARVFANWLLSKEGGAVAAPAIGYPSGRVDVPTDNFLPVMIPRKEDIRTEMEIEGWSLTKGQMQKVAAEVFAGLLK